MKKPKTKYKTHAKTSKVSEPAVAYQPARAGAKRDMELRIFNSFEEMGEYEDKQAAALSYDQRMENAEFLRRQVYHKYLLPNGKWKPVAKVINIMKPHTREISQ